MNYIPKLMEAMGLKEGERFKVKIQGRETDVVFWFTDKDLLFDAPDKIAVNCVTGVKTSVCGHASHQTLANILYGEYEVVKLPWVPKIGENYWCVKPSSDPDYPQTALVTMNYSIFTLFNLIFGNYFQTQDEAEEHKKYFVENLKSYEKAQRQQILERGK